MKRKKETRQNLAAVDLWAQVLEQLSQHRNATLQNPNYNPKHDEDRLRKGLHQAGWSDEHIEQRLNIHRSQIERAPRTSPGINPHAEFIFGRHCDAIEAIMDRRGAKSYSRLARGIEPRLGPHATLTNVIMTDEAIVTVGSQMFRFCGLIARAFTRTLLLNIPLWESDCFEKLAGMKLILENNNIAMYWTHIYLSYGTTGTNILAPFQPIGPLDIVIFEQVAHAMEIFAIAHEYGHHNRNHGRDISSCSAHREEYEADQFAFSICYALDDYPMGLFNPYIKSGAGGIVILFALDHLLQIRRKIQNAKVSKSASHPTVLDRISKFDSVGILKPNEFSSLRNFRTVSYRIMQAVGLILEDGILPHIADLPFVWTD